MCTSIVLTASVVEVFFEDVSWLIKLISVILKAFVVISPHEHPLYQGAAVPAPHDDVAAIQSLPLRGLDLALLHDQDIRAGIQALQRLFPG